jgi:hypothetical protein
MNRSSFERRAVLYYFAAVWVCWRVVRLPTVVFGPDRQACSFDTYAAAGLSRALSQTDTQFDERRKINTVLIIVEALRGGRLFRWR